MRFGAALFVLSIGFAHASPPVPAKLTACVLDGIMVTDDGFAITLAGSRRVDLTRYAGKKIRVTGDLQPGDMLFPTADVEVLGTCSADEKLHMLPTLAHVYRRQADRATAPAAPTAAPARKAPVIDCPDHTCYQIVRVPKAGGAPVVLRTAQLNGHIFVDASYVYWSEGDVGAWKMMRQPKRGGAPTSVAAGTLRGDMVRGPDGFYGVVSGGLAALGDGKRLRMLVPGVGADVAVDHDNVYFGEYGPENSTTIRSLPLGAGTGRTLAVGQPVSTTLAAANGELYWANINVPPIGGGQILKVPIGGGRLRTVVDTQAHLHPWALAVDARSVYWVEWDGSGYALSRAPKDGGDPTLLGIAPAQPMRQPRSDRARRHPRVLERSRERRSGGEGGRRCRGSGPARAW